MILEETISLENLEVKLRETCKNLRQVCVGAQGFYLATQAHTPRGAPQTTTPTNRHSHTVQCKQMLQTKLGTHNFHIYTDFQSTSWMFLIMTHFSVIGFIPVSKSLA